MAVRSGVDEQDPMEDLVDSVEEAYLTPEGSPPDVTYGGGPKLDPTDRNVPQGGPYKTIDEPMTYLDSERTEPPPARGDTR
jgi:hypothetical protein